MPIRVCFRGPMLILTGGPYVDKILLPNAEILGKYPDQSMATLEHYAGMFLIKAGNKIAPFSIANTNLSISDGSVARCDRDDSLNLLVPLDELVNGGADERLKPVNSNSPRVTSVVTFKGGKLIARTDSANTYEFPRTFNPGAPAARAVRLIAEWATTATSAHLSLTTRDGAQGKTFDLAEGDTAYVYNFHNLNTDEREFEIAANKCKGSTTPVEDEDFKWLFWLLDTPTDGWEKWRKNRLLPTPYFLCDEKTSAMAPKDVTAAASKEHAAEAKGMLLGPTDSDCLAGTFKI